MKRFGFIIVFCVAMLFGSMTAYATEDDTKPAETQAQDDWVDPKLIKHDLTPVWHPEWQARKEEFQIRAYEKIEEDPYIVTQIVSYIRNRKEEDRHNIVAQAGRGTLVYLVKEYEDGWSFVEARDEFGIVRGYMRTSDITKSDGKTDAHIIHRTGAPQDAFYDVPATSMKDLTLRYETGLKRRNLLNYAIQYLGNPYVWAGKDLDKGIDCSGFTQAVYAHFGIELPRCSYDQCETGERISLEDVQPGDLIFYAHGNRIYHVAICYTNDGEGNIEVLHARSEAHGIMISECEKDKVCWASRYITE